MMKLIDTHTHLYSPEFDEDRVEVIRRAIDSGVEKFYLPAIDSSYIAAMLQTKELFPDHVFLMAGLHPTSVKEDYKQELQMVEEFMSKYDYNGIGESGLDFYWDKTFIEEQKDSLHQHCAWAIEKNHPLILHTRDSIDDTLDIIEQYAAKGLRGIFHCFTGNLSQARRIIHSGFYLGIGGVLTFKNSGLDSVIKEISLDHIVLETDSPYLAPVPYRGKRNESSYIKHVAEKLAEIKNTSLEEVAAITSDNARKVFS